MTNLEELFMKSAQTVVKTRYTSDRFVICNYILPMGLINNDKEIDLLFQATAITVLLLDIPFDVNETYGYIENIMNETHYTLIPDNYRDRYLVWLNDNSKLLMDIKTENNLEVNVDGKGISTKHIVIPMDNIISVIQRVFKISIVFKVYKVKYV